VVQLGAVPFREETAMIRLAFALLALSAPELARDTGQYTNVEACDEEM